MILTRREAMKAAIALLPSLALAQNTSAPLVITLEVPVDHDDPRSGRIKLQCEWGAPPVPGRPTVVAVADAQQYYLRPGGAARLQAELFGTRLNLLAIVGRSRSEDLARLVMKPGGTDWGAAYRLLNWRQWARDLDLVIRHLELDRQRLGLYGRSGGALLIHQFLTLRPDLKARAYVQAAVNSELDARWGVGGDAFWGEFSARNPDTARELISWVERNPQHRRSLILVLQRQHFFENLETLPDARKRAAQAFLNGDKAVIAAMRERYQIDAIEKSRSTLEGVGGAVRVYEFAAPREDPRGDAGPLSPSHEATFYYAYPLAEPGHRPSVPPTDWSRLRDVAAEVVQVASRHDHTADYRTQIGLSGLTRNSRLLILNDDHVFKRWVARGTQPRFLQAFFLNGAASPDFQRELAALNDLSWRERPQA
jgi:hypothetical protein